jgi:CRISPR-associated endonuclease Csn1
MQSKQNLGQLTFGFDIGIASVGWAVLGETRIVDLGVRCFDAAEDPKTGDSLNSGRRLLKTQRNRLHRRVLRLKKLRRLLRDTGAVPNANIEYFASTSSKKGQSAKLEPWELRAKGLDLKLEGCDWARVLYHIIKHRGFYAARKSETIDEGKEGGKLTKGVKRTAALMQDKWRTLGEMATKDEAFVQAKRNKAGSYLNSFSRHLLDKELRLLFERQRALGSLYAGELLETEVLALLWYQKPAVTGLAMLEMIGKCTFEKTEYRAPKRSFSAERFVWLSKLNNIKIIQAGERRLLTPSELQSAKDLPYKLGKVTYRQLRKAIGLADAKDAGFAGFTGTKRNKKGEIVDPEEATLIELKGWHALKKELDVESTKSTWERISGNALGGNSLEIDAVALALSIYKSDVELKPELAKLGLDDVAIEAILKVDYSDFIQLSTKAIAKLMPYLEVGKRYDEACPLVGYNHAKPNEEVAGSFYLPAFNAKEIRNPVVFRALNQTRKVLNALLQKYKYSPVAIHVELARDLSKSWEERKEIEAGQKEFQQEKQAAVDYFVEQIGRKPKDDELLKMRLYREQGGQCAYTQQPLAPNGHIPDIFSDNNTQIDHILPHSRSFDDSQNNKVLVLTKQNQDKGNQIPFEYLDGANQSPRWRDFEAWVKSQTFRRAKREKLLRRSFTAEEAEGFKSRNLNDTRYITRYFADYVRRHLLFSADSSGFVKSIENCVLCPAGGLTSFLRARWGLLKNRAASDLHHALDACVIASANRSLQKRVSDFSRKNELVQLVDGTFVDKETGEVLSAEAASTLGERFPQPWSHFREEVLARLSNDGKTYLAKDGEFKNYDFNNYSAEEIAQIKPILVSRAVKRRAGGAVHQDTVRSVKSHLGEDVSSKRVRLESLKLADLENIVGSHDGRNDGLISVLRERLVANNDNGKKAFGANTPLIHKPRRDGTPGPLIRAVKVRDVQKGGVLIRGGIADQASIWRTDVFHKASKFYLIPIYQSDRRKNGKLPNRASTANTPRNEWTLVDDSFDFRFSLFPNDLIKLKNKESEFFGYFVGVGVATASISIRSHDNNEVIATGKAWQGVWVNLGVKTGIQYFEKLYVDVLGNIYQAKAEKQNGLA